MGAMGAESLKTDVEVPVPDQHPAEPVSKYAIVWSSYNWGGDDPGAKPWPGMICPTCAQAIRVHNGRLVDHFQPERSGTEPYDDMLCAGSDIVADAKLFERRGEYWSLIVRATGRDLGTYPTREQVETRLRETEAAKTDGVRQDAVRRFEKFDLSSELAKPRQTADGFWQVAGRVARVGIQEYYDGAGGMRRELRLPADVAASVPFFALQPLTNNHPPKMVDPANAKQYVAGAVGDAKFDGQWVTAPMNIWTADAISAVQAKRTQLSVGYSCRLEAANGEWNGQKYDAIQRDIIVNHVALVDMARAGTNARLRLDATDASTEALVRDTTGAVASSQGAEKIMAHVLKIDGLTYEVNDANAQASYDRQLKQLTDAAAADKTRADNADALSAKHQKDTESLQAKFDTLENAQKTILAEKVKIGAAEISFADFRDADKRDGFLCGVIEKAAAERASLIVEARKHLGANEKFDAHEDKDGKQVAAKSDLEIKRLVVLKLDKDAKLDGKSADYVQARYDAETVRVSKSTARPVERALKAVAPTIDSGDEPVVEQHTDAASARKAMEQRYLKINSTTLKA